jgi:uncharacterized protein involved in outer membrane biogenesis
MTTLILNQTTPKIKCNRTNHNITYYNGTNTNSTDPNITYYNNTNYNGTIDNSTNNNNPYYDIDCEEDQTTAKPLDTSDNEWSIDAGDGKIKSGEKTLISLLSIVVGAI